MPASPPPALCRSCRSSRSNPFPAPLCWLGFAVGVALLQIQESLPAWGPWGAALTADSWAVLASVVGWLMLLGGGVWLWLRWRVKAPRRLPFLGVALLALFLLGGFAYAAGRAQQRLAESLAVADEGRDVLVRGVIAGLPSDFSRGLRFEFRVEEVLTAGVQLPPRLALSWYRGHGWQERQAATMALATSLVTEGVIGSAAEAAPALLPEGGGGDGGGDEASGSPLAQANANARIPVAGERWQLLLRLKRPHGHINPGAFDYEAWLLERGIRATGYVRSPTARQVAAGAPRWPNRYLGNSEQWSDRLQAWRETLRQRLYAQQGGAGADEEARQQASGVLAALAVGDQQAIPGELWRTFARTGTTHLMSISGLHVTMFAALFGGLCGAGWRRWSWACRRYPAQTVAALGGLFAATVYTLLAGAAVPALRTLLMLAVCVLAQLMRRPLTAWTTLLLALLAVLLIDPWAVLAPGFWLSFLAVAALFLSGQGRLAELSGWRRFGLAQWAATLGTLPVLLWSFQQFSLVSPLANLLAIPWVSGLTTPLALLAAVLPVPQLTVWAQQSLLLLLAILDWLAAWPWAVWTPSQPGLFAVLLAAVGTVLLLLPRGLPGKWAAAMLLLPLLVHRPERPLPGSADITVLDVGQGLAVVVQTASHTLLYDTGPYYSAESDAGERLVLPFLRHRGIARLDTLIVTHQDQDHAGGARSVLESLPVNELLSSLPAAHPLLRAGDASMLVRPCLAPQQWQWDGIDFQLIYPQQDPQAVVQRSATGAPGIRANHVSCVLRIAIPGGESVLLTSDIEAADEQQLLAQPPAGGLRSAVVLVPHHGSRTSSTPAFIAAVGARHALLPVGYRNRFGHPRADVAARWQAAGARLWRTDQQGALTLHLQAGQPLQPEAARERQRRYWHSQFPPVNEPGR